MCLSENAGQPHKLWRAMSSILGLTGGRKKMKVLCQLTNVLIFSPRKKLFVKQSVAHHQSHTWNNLRSRSQSLSTNLLHSINDFTLSLKNKWNVTIAYVDYSKAFDIVSHPKLLLKLIDWGITA